MKLAAYFGEENFRKITALGALGWNADENELSPGSEISILGQKFVIVQESWKLKWGLWGLGGLTNETKIQQLSQIDKAI